MNFLELCLCGMSKAQLVAMGKGCIEKCLVHREVGLGILYFQCVSGSIFERDLQRVGFPGGSMVKNLPAKQETEVPSLGWEDPLEKEMATHSSILTWEIPWTGKPGGLQSLWLQRSQTQLRD